MASPMIAPRPWTEGRTISPSPPDLADPGGVATSNGAGASGSRNAWGAVRGTVAPPNRARARRHPPPRSTSLGSSDCAGRPLPRRWSRSRWSASWRGSRSRWRRSTGSARGSRGQPRLRAVGTRRRPQRISAARRDGHRRPVAVGPALFQRRAGKSFQLSLSRPHCRRSHHPAPVFDLGVGAAVVGVLRRAVHQPSSASTRWRPRAAHGGPPARDVGGLGRRRRFHRSLPDAGASGAGRARRSAGRLAQPRRPAGTIGFPGHLGCRRRSRAGHAAVDHCRGSQRFDATWRPPACRPAPPRTCG